MRLTLERNLYAFAVGSGATAELDVVSGDLAWSTQTSGPFLAEGTLRAGEHAEFDRSAIVQAAGRAEFDLNYPRPEPEGFQGEPDTALPAEVDSQNQSDDEATP